VKNNVAYGLAQNGDHLADAQLLVEQALPLREQQTADAVSGADPSKAFDQMILLSRFWDTAGYVYYRAHQLETAEAYLRAAWELNPNCLFAIHLGFVYEAEKKQTEATAIYRMGLSSKPAPVQLDELTTRLTKLGNSDAQAIPVDIVTPLPTLDLNLGPDDTEPLVDIALKHDSATIVTVVKGDSKLKKILAQAIQPALVSSLPDSGPEIILRRARVTCSASGTATCSLHFVTTGEYTVAEQLARRRAALPPLP
jgi:tetratricopeptide (TPR) repeat protein